MVMDLIKIHNNGGYNESILLTPSSKIKQTDVTIIFALKYAFDKPNQNNWIHLKACTLLV